MNGSQMAQQLKKLLEEAVWQGSGGVVVFGSQEERVIVSAGEPSRDMLPLLFPNAMVMIGEGDPDDDDPDLISQKFRIVCGAQVWGARGGEETIIGGPTSDVLTSEGKGVAEIQERVLDAVGDLTGMDGNQIQVVSASKGAPRNLGGVANVAFADCRLRALCTQDLHYVEPVRLALASNGRTWTWEGSHCVARFDFIQFRLGWHATAAQSDPADTTIVETIASAETVEYTATTGRYYSIFADYNPRDPGAGAVIGSSDGALVGSFLAAP